VPTVGVVIIGRNEGARLERCLRSAVGEGAKVVYVDSGSSDQSVATARALGAEVIELDLKIPFTAARARNAGFDQLVSNHPEMEFVQFVDGDCEVVAGWIKRALEEMCAKPQAAIVCGRRRERFPDASVYNKLCDIEWNTPIGEAKSCGGDAMVRVDAFKQVNGYNANVIAGEEPEMCVRLRAKSWQVWRIDAEMTLHDAAMTKFSQWWRRSVRAGHAYAEGYAMHGALPERHWARENRSNWIWGAMLPMLIIGSAVAAAASGVTWMWWIAIAFLLLYPLQVIRVGLRSGSFAYASFVVLGKFPQMLGQLKYHLSRFNGNRVTVIEYKRPLVQ
jgi:glycosyltransferase involved in cell wall biosynthesis